MANINPNENINCKYPPLQIGNFTASVPIVQGGMGVGVSLGGLAGAVAKEGGVGIISTAQIGFCEPDFEKNVAECNLRAMEKELQKAREIAGGNGIIGFNIMVALRQYEDQVKTAVKAGADLIISGAGLPVDLPAYVGDSNTKIAPIVSSAKSAKVILKFWDKRYNRTADMLVIEGPKAGGHLGFTKEQVENYLQYEGAANKPEEANFDGEVLAILEVVREYASLYNTQIPVVVAGGISSAEEMTRVMALGVQGVQVATPFITTEECDADVNYKMAFVNAQKEDIQIVKSPVGMPGRAILNPFMKKVMAGQQFPPKKCLGCLQKCNPSEIPYCITEALIQAAKGEVDDALLFCGVDGYKAEQITTVREVIQQLIK